MLKSLLAAVVTLALLTCPFPARAYEKTILKVGMGDPIDSEMGAIGTRFKEVVEARSEGKVEVQLFPSGQLGDETEMIQNVRAGNLDIAVVGIANTVPFVKKLGILTMPYLFDDMYDIVRATTGPAHDLLNGYAIREGGFRILGWTYTDYRYISNSRKPIKNLNDIKGLKFRVPQSAILLACYKDLHAGLDEPLPRLPACRRREGEAEAHRVRRADRPARGRGRLEECRHFAGLARNGDVRGRQSRHQRLPLRHREKTLEVGFPHRGKAAS